MYWYCPPPADDGRAADDDRVVADADAGRTVPPPEAAPRRCSAVALAGAAELAPGAAVRYDHAFDDGGAAAAADALWRASPALAELGRADVDRERLEFDDEPGAALIFEREAVAIVASRQWWV